MQRIPVLVVPLTHPPFSNKSKEGYSTEHMSDFRILLVCSEGEIYVSKEMNFVLYELLPKTYE